jgi:sec-independent protein translocase protein TatC
MVTSSHDREMSLMEHLTELRTRLMIAAGAVLVTTIVAFVFTEQIIKWLLIPAGGIKLLAVEPTETFTTYFRVALYAGIALAMPVILYEVYRYIDPALHPHERRFVLAMGAPVLALFIIGILFCYFVILPNAINFLFNFGGDIFIVMPRASAYLSFVTTFMLGMGLVFEMPAIIYALVRVHVLDRAWLAKQRRYVFLVCFIIGAVITPTPDPFNQTLVSLPLYLLFELGLFLSRFAMPKRESAPVTGAE